MVPSPTGISNTNFFTPIESFFVKIEGIINPTGSICKGLSISISMLSAGDMSKAPPQTIKAFSLATISFNSSELKATGANTSILSAVPDGDVIARVLVFGIVKPVAATIGTITRETLLPGTPPFS